MRDILTRNNIIGTGKGLTYALRGIFLGDSLDQIQWLLDQSSTDQVKSTVTIWGTDNLTQHQLDGLRHFVASVGKDRCFTDTTANI